MKITELITNSSTIQPTEPVRKRNSYTLLYKRQVLEALIERESLGHRNSKATVATDYNVDYVLLCRWSNDRAKYLNTMLPSNLRKIGCGRSIKYPEEEKYLVDWVRERRALNWPVKNFMMATEAMRKFPLTFSSFESCTAWTYNIMERNQLSSRRKTHNQIALEESEMGAIHLDFIVHFHRLADFHRIPLKLCVNMDETGCYFEMSSNTTIQAVGSKHVNIRSTGNSNHCTVFLSVALDGSKLKPLVVFKGKPNGTVSKTLQHLDKRNAYLCQEKAYCDGDVMSDWIKSCLKPYHDGNSPAILMMDNFKAHLISNVRKELARNGWLQLNLPANMTSRVQVLDVGINKPFKDRMRTYYNQYLISNPENPKITRELMGKWIADAWEDLPATAITNTARKIGFIKN